MNLLPRCVPGASSLLRRVQVELQLSLSPPSFSSQSLLPSLEMWKWPISKRPRPHTLPLMIASHCFQYSQGSSFSAFCLCCCTLGTYGSTKRKLIPTTMFSVMFMSGSRGLFCFHFNILSIHSSQQLVFSWLLNEVKT